jgi:hypothetical protein
VTEQTSIINLKGTEAYRDWLSGSSAKIVDRAAPPQVVCPKDFPYRRGASGLAGRTTSWTVTVSTIALIWLEL